MVLPGRRLRGVESKGSYLVDSWETYAFLFAALIRLLMVSRYASWLWEEYPYVCST